jgi:hypothetical protein
MRCGVAATQLVLSIPIVRLRCIHNRNTYTTLWAAGGTACQPVDRWFKPGSIAAQNTGRVCSISVCLITAALLEIGNESDGIIGRTRAMLCDDVDECAFDVLAHADGAADINVRTLGDPPP